MRRQIIMYSIIFIVLTVVGVAAGVPWPTAVLVALFGIVAEIIRRRILQRFERTFPPERPDA
ncbi:MAG: hypothetical protein Fur005_41730 [Roseiflexaceae bacterium]